MTTHYISIKANQRRLELDDSEQHALPTLCQQVVEEPEIAPRWAVPECKACFKIYWAALDRLLDPRRFPDAYVNTPEAE